MGAGLSIERQRRIEYNELHRIQRELIKAHVVTTYSKRQLTGAKDGATFTVRYSRSNASNGECCLFPFIDITGTRTADGVWRGWYEAQTYEQGLEHVKNLFAAPEVIAYWESTAIANRLRNSQTRLQEN